MRPSLGESTHIVCPRCVGQGNIRGVESMALAILRLIGEEARKDRTSRVIAQVPVEVATFLMNEKREALGNIEKKGSAEVVLVPNPNMLTPNYVLRRVRDDETLLAENTGTSYQLATPAAEPAAATSAENGRDKKPAPQPAVVPMLASAATPMPCISALALSTGNKPSGLLIIMTTSTMPKTKAPQMTSGVTAWSMLVLAKRDLAGKAGHVHESSGFRRSFESPPSSLE